MGICESFSCQSNDQNKYYNQIKKSICTIVFSKNTKCTGFLIKLKKNGQNFFCLMTKEHFIQYVLNNKIILVDEIYVTYDEGKKTNTINLESNKRFVKNFSGLGADITVIEIFPSDNISEKYLSLPDLESRDKLNELINKDITIIQSSAEINALNIRINNINKNEFTFLENGISFVEGSPIVLKNNYGVIGIYQGKKIDTNENYANFIEPIVKFFDFFPENLITDGSGLYVSSGYSFGSSGTIAIIKVNFMNVERKVNIELISKSDEKFSIVVNKFYERCPFLGNNNCTFMHNGEIMDQNLTMEQNNCKSDVKIEVLFNED